MKIFQVHSKDGTGTLSYIIKDTNSNFAVVIDPNIEDTKTILSIVKENNLKVTHIIDTHTHADHISGAGELKNHLGSKILMHEITKDKMKVLKEASKFGIEDILLANAKIEVDVYLNDNDVLNAGNLELKILHTPGHTDNHITILAEDALFTGDLLLIGQAGRSDLPGGNTEEQYESIFNKIVNLPGNTKIYPGHDYENNESRSPAERFAFLKDELINNPFLKKRTKEEYIEFVKDFFPPIADGFDGKVILQCGVKRVMEKNDEFKSINVNQISKMLSEGEPLYLLDVREPFELLSGAIEGVVNIPLGKLSGRISELPEDKSKKIVCICRSGNRSYEACHLLFKAGYKNVMNLEGGTAAWKAEKLKTI